MKKLRNFLRISCIILMIGIAFVGYELYISKYGLETTHYTIPSDRIEHGFRIVQLTDLHDSEFGKGNEKLVRAVEKEKPDLILITGDLVNCKSGENTSIAIDLISDLSGIAPVYFSYGNQEKDLEERYGTEITRLFTEAGAVVLDGAYQDITVNDQKIRLGGIYGYCLSDIFAWQSSRTVEADYLKEFQDTDLYTILMCHMPVCWIRDRSLYDWDVDCVFSGHAHGGQVRIPFVGGLWAPDQGWFPGEECGLYTTTEEEWEAYLKDAAFWAEHEKAVCDYYRDSVITRKYKPKTMVLSRGLGNTDKLPRFHNIPEIVVVDFITM